MKRRDIDYLVAQFNGDEALEYLRSKCGWQGPEAECTVRRMRGWLRSALTGDAAEYVHLTPLVRRVVAQQLSLMIRGDGSPETLRSARAALDQIGEIDADDARDEPRLPVSDSDRRETNHPRPAEVRRVSSNGEYVVTGVACGAAPMVKPSRDYRIQKIDPEWQLVVDGDVISPLWGTLRAARIEASRLDAESLPTTVTAHSPGDAWSHGLKAYIRGAFAGYWRDRRVESVRYDVSSEEWVVNLGGELWRMRISSDDDEFCFRSDDARGVFTFPIPEEL